MWNANYIRKLPFPNSGYKISRSRLKGEPRGNSSKKTLPIFGYEARHIGRHSNNINAGVGVASTRLCDYCVKAQDVAVQHVPALAMTRHHRHPSLISLSLLRNANGTEDPQRGKLI